MLLVEGLEDMCLNDRRKSATAEVFKKNKQLLIGGTTCDEHLGILTGTILSVNMDTVVAGTSAAFTAILDTAVVGGETVFALTKQNVGNGI